MSIRFMECDMAVEVLGFQMLVPSILSVKYYMVNFFVCEWLDSCILFIGTGAELLVCRGMEVARFSLSLPPPPSLLRVLPRACSLASNICRWRSYVVHKLVFVFVQANMLKEKA